MLGKMMKHEWNAVMKVMLPANAVLVIITLLGRIMVSAKIFDMDNEIASLISGLSITLYILCLLAVSLCCTIFIGYRFYKTVYTDEGYLLHTLPVTTHEIILSKTLTGVAWILITSLFLFASVFILVLGFIPPNEYASAMRDISYGIETYIGPKFTAWVIFFLFIMIAGAFYSALWLFAGISFGQLLPKHKVLGAFIGFGVIYVLTQIISVVTMLGTGLIGKANDMAAGSADAVISYMEYVYITSFSVNVLLAVGFYFFTHFMMNRKLNLD